ncbi:hypothetical protein E2R62_06920 [Citrobacter rodentium]|uniref:Uncharacterized protein n=1 Tax=Citrobacter rodentium TaxID=67825 RepID=A0A482PKN2_CITRO|nr:hypothetical protein E2R62_06920 [Citrobacter rodentium]HAT8011930.1 hypothetical protein [Citrobacter rodentium NBRC 105723 = DSM 16636]HAT8016866.1 hypothetical protein [Citrobacter rodentium]HAT8026575.1 hypothetical protein [Citrobacter rodentium]HAT8031656.1 hypothetical protein [Citrobacter rodentium]
MNFFNALLTNFGRQLTISPYRTPSSSFVVSCITLWQQGFIENNPAHHLEGVTASPVKNH